MEWKNAINIIEYAIQSGQLYDICAEICDELEPPPKRTRNRQENIIDYTRTNWGKFIRDKHIRDPTSSVGLLFRRRFRVPFILFEYILQLCIESNTFEVQREELVVIPVEIKLLVSLRIMGRGESLDSIAEYSEVSESYCSTIFHKFITNFKSKYESQFIKKPEGIDLQNIMKEYANKICG